MLSILSLLTGASVHRTVARAKRTSIFLALALLLILTAYALAVTAGAIWLAGIYGPVGAALFLAACALLIAVILVVVMVMINAQDKRRARERRAALESLAAVGLGLVRAQPLLTAGVLAAIAAANLVGSKREG
ncbi:UNVERIFIED_ORG: phosphoglycerol transferase MdoB-like AlkP superfamily enzyme [Rhizobium esperanzae]